MPDVASPTQGVRTARGRGLVLSLVLVFVLSPPSLVAWWAHAEVGETERYVAAWSPSAASSPRASRRPPPQFLHTIVSPRREVDQRGQGWLSRPGLRGGIIRSALGRCPGSLGRTASSATTLEVPVRYDIRWLSAWARRRNPGR